MAEPGYLQLIAGFWEWVQQEISTWLRAFGNLKEVLAERDLLSDDTLKFSLRFSAFNIVLAMLVDLPPKVFFVPKGVSVLTFGAQFVLYYIMTFVFCLSLKLMSIIFISRTPIRICLIFALLTTIYWPLNNLMDYIILSDKSLYEAFSTPDIRSFLSLTTNYSMNLIMIYIITLLICSYILVSIIPAIRYSFRVGWLRGMVILFGSSSLVFVFQTFPLRPIWQAMIKTEFGT